MKPTSLLPIIATVFLAVPQGAHAWWGGPFDQGIPSANPLDAAFGTYQGVISGRNVTGVTTFGSQGTSPAGGAFVGAGSQGRIALFIKGELVLGDVQSITNPASKKIAGVFEGSKSLGSETFAVQDFVETNVLDSSTTTTVTNTTNPATDNTTTTTTETTTIERDTLAELPDELTLNKFLYVAGEFSADIERTYALLTFSGRGKLRVEDPTGNISIDVNELERAVMLDQDSSSTSNTSTTTTPDPVDPVLNPPIITVDTTDTTTSNSTEVTDRLVMTGAVPSLDEDTIKFRINGARTAFTAPLFTGTLTVSRSNVTFD